MAPIAGPRTVLRGLASRRGTDASLQRLRLFLEVRRPATPVVATSPLRRIRWVKTCGEKIQDVNVPYGDEAAYIRLGAAVRHSGGDWVTR